MMKTFVCAGLVCVMMCLVLGPRPGASQEGPVKPAGFFDILEVGQTIDFSQSRDKSGITISRNDGEPDGGGFKVLAIGPDYVELQFLDRAGAGLKSRMRISKYAVTSISVRMPND